VIQTKTISLRCRLISICWNYATPL